MSGKPWQLDTDIPTPSLFSPNSSNLDVSSISIADESTLGNDIILSLQDGKDNSSDNGEIVEEEELPVTPKELKGWYIYNAAVS
ncbi:unnamed protein product [Rhizophagus irregularis]|nr:unnamed protein product [Rhizophagus irregularis]